MGINERSKLLPASATILALFEKAAARDVCIDCSKAALDAAATSAAPKPSAAACFAAADAACLAPASAAIEPATAALLPTKLVTLPIKDMLPTSSIKSGISDCPFS